MSDYGGRHFVNLVMGPKSKNTHLQNLVCDFALENSSILLYCIKGIHFGHSLTLFCIRTAVILIFVIVRL